jgi:hypothetical protein
VNKEIKENENSDSEEETQKSVVVDDVGVDLGDISCMESKTLDKEKNLGMKKIENNFINPLFSKISANYDQGGAAGLLLSSLPLDSEFNYLLYNSGFVNKFGSVGLRTDILDRISKKIKKIKEDMNMKKVCPSLVFFRKEVFEEEENREKSRKTDGLFFDEKLDKINFDNDFVLEKDILMRLEDLKCEYNNVEVEDFVIENEENLFEENSNGIDLNSKNFEISESHFENIAFDEDKEEDSEKKQKIGILSENFDFWKIIHSRNTEVKKMPIKLKKKTQFQKKAKNKQTDENYENIFSLKEFISIEDIFNLKIIKAKENQNKYCLKKISKIEQEKTLNTRFVNYDM